MTEVEIRGADQLARLARQLKEAGDRGLQRELYGGINRAMKPVREDLKRSAVSGKIPRRGGLAAKVAASRFRTRRRTSAWVSGIRLEATNQYTLGRLNRGQVRHPIPNNRDVWVTQQIEPGWFTEPTQAAAPRVRAEIELVMRLVAKQIERAV
jgi:hypothetical protein